MKEAIKFILLIVICTAALLVYYLHYYHKIDWFRGNESKKSGIKKEEKKKDKEITKEEVSLVNNNIPAIAQMPKKLKEISGIVKDGNFLWAISDNPKADIYKLDLSGNVVQQITLKNNTVSDVEDVTADANYLYIEDVGDNDGNRTERQIIKIKKSAIGNGEKADVEGEAIRFSFPPQSGVQTKKENENDCEAIISYKDALCLFTKRRSDKQTQLFMLPKTPGRQVPKAIALFDSKGLITGAAINDAGDEVALVGYQKGHQQPFIWLLSGFTGNNFFSGQQQQYVLTNDDKDWQVEGITYKDNNKLFFTCEATDDFAATLYVIAKENLTALGNNSK